VWNCQVDHHFDSVKKKKSCMYRYVHVVLPHFLVLFQWVWKCHFVSIWTAKVKNQRPQFVLIGHKMFISPFKEFKERWSLKNKSSNLT